MSFLEWLQGYAVLGLPGGLLLGLLLGWWMRRETGPGGYASFARRATRLGHVAAVMLPLIGGFYALAFAAWGPAALPPVELALLWIAGGVLLVLVLFLAAWRPALRLLLPLPAVLLTATSVLFALRLVP